MTKLETGWRKFISPKSSSPSDGTTDIQAALQLLDGNDALKLEPVFVNGLRDALTALRTCMSSSPPAPTTPLTLRTYLVDPQTGQVASAGANVRVQVDGDD